MAMHLSSNASCKEILCKEHMTNENIVMKEASIAVFGEGLG